MASFILSVEVDSCVQAVARGCQQVPQHGDWGVRVGSWEPLDSSLHLAEPEP